MLFCPIGNKKVVLEEIERNIGYPTEAFSERGGGIHRAPLTVFICKLSNTVHLRKRRRRRR